MVSVAVSPVCPTCGSTESRRESLSIVRRRLFADEPIMRICKSCKHRFADPNQPPVKPDPRQRFTEDPRRRTPQ